MIKVAAAVLLTVVAVSVGTGSADAKWRGTIAHVWEKNKKQMPFAIGAAAIVGACIASSGAGCTVVVVTAAP